MSTITNIYTDGACSGNPGPGGWGTRIEFDDGQVHELGGRDTDTTNNRMEMQAAIAALEFVKTSEAADIDGDPICLHTDSEYLKNGITKWIKGWKRKGWKTSAGKPVLNKDLWQQLDSLTQSLQADQLKVDWRYVRGHAGNPGNERCDEIARAYSHAQPISLNQRTDKTKTTDKINGIDASHREKSLETTERNTGTRREPFGSPALRFYEKNAEEESQDMATSTLSKSNTYQEIPRIDRLKNALETLKVTDELAKQGYLITSAELADLMDVNASAVTSRGDYWAWRNWTVSRIRREGNQILWQLERIDE
ncbi:MAG: ribonuclease HI [Cyanobacteria bacterium J06614_10]